MTTNAEHGASVRAFAEEFARMYREGDTAGIEAVHARHRAAGFGGPVAPHLDAISACVPGPEVPGPYVMCICGLRMPADSWGRHVELSTTLRGVHRSNLRGLGARIDIPARQV